MFEFIKPYVWIVEILVMLAFVTGLFVTGWHFGAKHVQASWNVAIVKQDLIVAQANAKTIAIQQHDAQVSQDISARYESQLSELRKNYAQKSSVAYGIVCHDRMRVSHAPTSSSAVPKISNGTNSPDAATTNTLDAQQIATLPEDCSVTTQQLVDLQAWVSAIEK